MPIIWLSVQWQRWARQLYCTYVRVGSGGLRGSGNDLWGVVQWWSGTSKPARRGHVLRCQRNHLPLRFLLIT